MVISVTLLILKYSISHVVFIWYINDKILFSFQANFAKVGKVFKIRLELMPKSQYKDPSWKVGEVKMHDLGTKESLKFSFNRWLSRKQDDQEIMRELPVIRSGEETMPCKG